MRVLLVLPGLVLLGAGALSLSLGRTELTLSGWLWSLESLALGAALSAWWLKGPRARSLQASSVLALVLLAGYRVATRGRCEDVSLVVLDEHGGEVGSARWIDRLFDERDAAIVGSRALTLLGAVPAREFPTLPALLAASYPQLEDEAPTLGTPIPATLLGLQGPDASDAIVVEPQGGPARIGVVFLHGYAGSFALQCLEVARAVRSAPARVVCPAAPFDGAWWCPDEERIARGAIAYLRHRGADTIVLVGLSNGARGAALLAPRLRGEIDALILLSGTASEAVSPPVPTLLIQGDRDRMMRTSRVRAWARGRRGVRYLELPGTHFVLLEQRDAVARALGSFVAASARRAAR